MKSNQIRLVILIICLAFSTILAQETKNELFRDADAAKVRAEGMDADILSPNNYKLGMEFYRDAEKAYLQGSSENQLKNILGSAIKYFDLSIRVAESGLDKLEGLLNARKDAVIAEAPQFASKLWIEAEQNLISVTEDLESSKIEDAVEDANDVVKLYRDAELEAIKSQYFNDIINLQNEAINNNAEKYAPKTLSKSKSQLELAEKKLSENRYNTEEAVKIIKDAKRNAQYSNYLAKFIQRISDENLTSENLVLLLEQTIYEIAAAIEIEASYENGAAGNKNKILEKINKQLVRIKELQKENNELIKRINEFENRTSLVKVDKVKERLKNEENFQEKFNEVEKLFKLSEALVINDNGKILLRMTGLIFGDNKFELTEFHYNLLSRVVLAINKFSKAKVVVEGHTNSWGNSVANMELSKRRANAVFNYLLNKTNMKPGTIESKAFGQLKPIASNETKEGRAKNERIDIIIDPNM